jgi:NADH-ubiquinone oxidoreductase chain 4
MFLYILLLVPVIGIFLISSVHSYSIVKKSQLSGVAYSADVSVLSISEEKEFDLVSLKNVSQEQEKKIALSASIINLIISLVIYLLFDFSYNEFQFVQEHLDLSFYNIYLGLDGISIYFVLLTTIIMPVALMSN